MTMCCPLGGNDGDAPRVHEVSFPVARKDHECMECREVIPKGTKYEFVRGMWDDQWSTYRTCLPCVAIRRHFQCRGWVYETLWEDLRENFFPDMKVGGPCMSGLSPEGKRKLIDERMAWVFAHDEWEPPGFALPPKYQPQRPKVVKPDGTRIAEFAYLDGLYPDDDQ